VWANVPHGDRACTSDDECRALGDGSCFDAALNVGGAAKPEYATFPCGNPAAGACARARASARCAQGCCELVQQE
jgi:hypothetical protein